MIEGESGKKSSHCENPHIRQEWQIDKTRRDIGRLLLFSCFELSNPSQCWETHKKNKSHLINFAKFGI